MNQFFTHFGFLALFTVFIWWGARPALTRWIVVTRIVANLALALGVFIEASYLPTWMLPVQDPLQQTAVFWLIICISIMVFGLLKEEVAYHKKEVL